MITYHSDTSVKRNILCQLNTHAGGLLPAPDNCVQIIYYHASTSAQKLLREVKP